MKSMYELTANSERKISGGLSIMKIDTRYASIIHSRQF